MKGHIVDKYSVSFLETMNAAPISCFFVQTFSFVFLSAFNVRHVVQGTLHEKIGGGKVKEGLPMGGPRLLTQASLLKGYYCPAWEDNNTPPFVYKFAKRKEKQIALLVFFVAFPYRNIICHCAPGLSLGPTLREASPVPWN